MKSLLLLIIGFVITYLGISVSIIIGGIVLENNYVNYKFIFEDSFRPSLFIFCVIVFFNYLMTPKK